MPRKGRRAKTDRLDAEGMTRTLRAWLSGDREVARDVRIPTVEEEDAKRIERERKHLVEQRTSIVGRIKGLLALHGIHLSGKRIGKGLQERLEDIKTGDGRQLAPFLRRDIERMLRHYEFICDQIKEVEADRKSALTDETGHFPHREKVHRLVDAGCGRRDDRNRVGRRGLPSHLRNPPTCGIIRRTGSESLCKRGDEPRSRDQQSWHQARAANVRRAGVVLAPLPTKQQAVAVVARAVWRDGDARPQGWHRRSRTQIGDRPVALRRGWRHPGRRDAEGVRENNELLSLPHLR